MEIKGLSFFYQKKLPLCVPCSLNTLLCNIKENYMVKELAKKFRINILYGADLLEILNFLRKRKLEVFPFICSAKKISVLLNENFPLLIWFKRSNHSHTCVVFGFKTNEIDNSVDLILHDPAKGKTDIKSEILDKMGTIKDFLGFCHYLLILKKDDFLAKRDIILRFIEKDPFYYNIIGELFYFYQNNPKKALKYWKHALTLKEDYAEVHNNISIYHLNITKNFNLALEFARKAREVDPDEPTYGITMGEVYFKMGETKTLFSLISELEENWQGNIDILKFKRRIENEFGKIRRFS